MLENIYISNYKSIKNLELSLSHLNVLIGTNGSGKSNILEALATASAAYRNSSKIDIEYLENKGVRIAKPNLTLSSFYGLKGKKSITFDIQLTDKENYKFDISPESIDDIYSAWNVHHHKRKDSVISIDELIHILNENQIQVDRIKSKKNNKEIIDGKELKTVTKNLNEVKKLLENNIEDIFETSTFNDFCIYTINTQALRGFSNVSKKKPLGLNGEGLDQLLSVFTEEENNEILNYIYLIDWMKNYEINSDEQIQSEGYKIGRSKSTLYFRDKYMRNNCNCFSTENVNEGALHILFYLALIISKKTPSFFAIDNIEASLNPGLCRRIIGIIAELAVKHNKQILITTHNPAILDGLDLNNESQCLYTVMRKDNGETSCKRVVYNEKMKNKMKLSEMWMNGFLGAVPKKF